MEFDGGISTFDIPFKVVIVDLLLSGDNAVLIALACRSLPPLIMRRAILFGTVFAIALRFVLTSMVGSLLLVPYLKLVGAVALLVIAIKLIVGEDDDDALDPSHTSENFWVAVRLIVVADIVMSVDNVIALAAVVRGSFGYLAMGLLLSVPLLVYGSAYFSGLMNRYPILVTAGGAMLAWAAGDVALSDPVIAGWIDSQAFALHAAVPLAAALFAIYHSRIIAEQRRLAPAGHRGPDLITEKVTALVKWAWDYWNPEAPNMKAEKVVAPAAKPVVPQKVEPPKPVPKIAPIDRTPDLPDTRPPESRALIFSVLIGLPLVLLGILVFMIKSAAGL
jgi:YjbE family integral membrane protein